MSGLSILARLHWRRRIAAASLALTLIPVTVAQVCPGADPAALAWLEKMSSSVHKVSYNGVVTLQRGEDMQVMQVSHAVAQGVSSEQLTQLTGQGAQIDRVAHPLACVHPGHRLLQVSEDLRAGHCGIAQYYRFSLADGERVAGRQAVRILVEPRDMYRFGYIMELDKETALLLKTQTLGRGNSVLEKFQFANLAYTGHSPEGAQVNLVHHASHPLPGAPTLAGHSAGPWTVNWVPRGFVPTDSAGSMADRRTYTDGLAVFSVFLEELTQEIRPGEGLIRSGGTTSYTRGMDLAGQPVLVTVIGEVPVNTARMVADSVARVR